MEEWKAGMVRGMRELEGKESGETEHERLEDWSGGIVWGIMEWGECLREAGN